MQRLEEIKKHAKVDYGLQNPILVKIPEEAAKGKSHPANAGGDGRGLRYSTDCPIAASRILLITLPVLAVRSPGSFAS